MSFLFPAALALAGLALVPLLLHLVRRETDRRVPFPSLRYLKSAQRESARSMRIRDWLLVAARMAMIFLLAAVASRPLIGTGDAGSHRPTDLVLILDNTASMDRLAGDRSILETAREAAAVSLSRVAPEDRVWLISAVDGVIVAGGSGEEAARLLPTIRPSDAGGSLPLSARLASSAISRGDGRVRELQLFTDLQASSFEGDAELGEDWAVRVLHVAPDRDVNGSVASLSIGPTLPVPPGASFAVTARLESRSGSGTDTPLVRDTSGAPGPEARLLVDGRTAAIRGADWGSDVVFSLQAPSPGPHVVRVEIDPAGLRADDGRQAGIRVAASARVRLWDTSVGDAEFIRKALETLESDERVRFSADPVDVIVQVGGAAARDQSEPGRPPARILIPPSDPLALPAFNRELVRVGVPWSAEPDPAPGSLRLQGDGTPAFSGETVTRRYRLVAGTAPSSSVDSVLLRTSDGEPWLARGRMAQAGVYLLLASPLLPEATGLPAGAGMIEFVDALVNWWSQPGDPAGWLDAGEEMVLPPRADSIAGPDGPAVRVEGGAPWRPRLAGSWRISMRSEGGREARYVGVNVPAAESDPATLDRVGLAASFGSATDLRVSSPDEWHEVIFARRRGRDISALLLAVGIALLALESWLAGPRRGRPDRAATAESEQAGA